MGRGAYIRILTRTKPPSGNQVAPEMIFKFCLLPGGTLFQVTRPPPLVRRSMILPTWGCYRITVSHISDRSPDPWAIAPFSCLQWTYRTAWAPTTPVEGEGRFLEVASRYLSEMQPSWPALPNAATAHTTGLTFRRHSRASRPQAPTPALALRHIPVPVTAPARCALT